MTEIKGARRKTVLPATSGIYQIRCGKADAYIGGTLNMRSRESGHVNMLRNGSHYNDRLQDLWNLLGPEEFTFTVLEACEPAMMGDLENAWISRLRPSLNIQGKHRHSARVLRSKPMTDVVARVDAGVAEKFDALAKAMEPRTSRSALIAHIIDQYVEKHWPEYERKHQV